LVVDNAPYHTVAPVGKFYPRSTMTRDELVQGLRMVKCTKLTFKRMTKTDGDGEPTPVYLTVNPRSEASIGTRKADDKPSQLELYEAAYQYVKEKHPDHLVTDLQSTMADNNGVVIFLPPYGYDAMPIEMVWGLGKSGVAASYSSDGRTLDGVIEAFRNTLYNRHSLQFEMAGSKPVANSLAERIIDHAARGLNDIVERRHSALAKRGDFRTWTLKSNEQASVNEWILKGGASDADLGDVTELSVFNELTRLPPEALEALMVDDDRSDSEADLERDEDE
jgi:hypothetical protein